MSQDGEWGVQFYLWLFSLRLTVQLLCGGDPPQMECLYIDVPGPLVSFPAVAGQLGDPDFCLSIIPSGVSFCPSLPGQCRAMGTSMTPFFQKGEERIGETVPRASEGGHGRHMSLHAFLWQDLVGGHI